MDGRRATRIFIVKTAVVLRNLTIANGFTENDGGAAYVASVLSATDCFFVGNKASDLGGAIFAEDRARLEFVNCTFDRNVGEEGGGAIFMASDGQLIVTGSMFSSNRTSNPGSLGGAIWNSGTAMVDSSTFQTNTAFAGGAIFNQSNLTVTASTFSNNGEAGLTQAGGAIFNQAGAAAKITNSTFGGNVGDRGGGTLNNGQMTIHFCTFSGNSAGQGAAISDSAQRPYGTNVSNSILAESIRAPSGSGGNCSLDGSTGRIIDGFYNISDDDTCHFAGTGANKKTIGDLVDPKLDPKGLVKEKDAATATIAVQPGSPAVDAVAINNCADTHTDQRGMPRPDPEDTSFPPAC